MHSTATGVKWSFDVKCVECLCGWKIALYVTSDCKVLLPLMESAILRMYYCSINAAILLEKVKYFHVSY